MRQYNILKTVGIPSLIWNMGIRENQPVHGIVHLANSNNRSGKEQNRGLIFD